MEAVISVEIINEEEQLQRRGDTSQVFCINIEISQGIFLFLFFIFLLVNRIVFFKWYYIKEVINVCICGIISMIIIILLFY